MRYAEVLLNGVEAAVEMGQHLDDALIWINDIRDRAGVKTLNSSDLTIDKVRNERRIELAFENHTYWDLRRWRIADSQNVIQGYLLTSILETIRIFLKWLMLMTNVIHLM